MLREALNRQCLELESLTANFISFRNNVDYGLNRIASSYSFDDNLSLLSSEPLATDSLATSALLQRIQGVEIAAQFHASMTKEIIGNYHIL
jgi:hypothetical protein